LAAGYLLGTRLGTPPADAGEDDPPAGPVVAGDHRHPLDPLTAEEIAGAVKVAREQGPFADGVFIPFVVVNEPAKKDVAAWKPGDEVRRQAFLVAFDRPANKTYEAVVDLTTGKLVGQPRHVPGAQPAALINEWEGAGLILKNDPAFNKALEARGLTRDDVQLDAWALGHPQDRAAGRYMRIVCYQRWARQDGRRVETKNPYGRPIEGLTAVVDLTNQKVVELKDRDPKHPVPTDSADYFDPKYIGKARDALKPLEVRQPRGANFEVRGQEVRWQNWRFRVSLHPREGLVLHTVAYQDGDRLRSILHRASVSEMVVPYGDPDGDAWSWRNAFDVGEYGLGQLVTTQRPGHEVPSHATLLPAVLVDDFGKPEPRKDVVALYEQDGGLLWMHYEWMSRETTTRRARQLVVQSVFTVGNYDYVFKWVFGQDGALEAQAELTGVGLMKGVTAVKCPACEQPPYTQGKVRSTREDRYGKLVGPGLTATNHQHFFCYRLDFDVDGEANSVEEMNVVPETEKPNPDGNGFLVETTLLRTEKEARRNLDVGSHRSWKVFNPSSVTSLGHRAGYKLEPGVNSVPFARPEAKVRQRAGLLDHHLWVTRHKDRELYAAGDYPNQSTGNVGLPKWSDGDDVADKDVVLWYVMGVTHVARPEEWPVMPVTRAGFRLVPDGFFTHNPALDVP
jgi:primary-amine oxidase